MMAFLYQITNTLNGMIYVGVHEGAANDGYLGSGARITRAVKKHGREHFVRTILQEFATAEEAYDVEALVVDEQFIRRPDVYNMTPGGRGGWRHAVKYGDDNVMRRPEVAAKVAASIKANMTETERARRSKTMSAMRRNGTVSRATGWKHTAGSKALMSERRAGGPAWNAGISTGPEPDSVREAKRAAAKKRAATQDMGALGRGKTYTMRKITCPHCGLIGSGGNMTRYHFDACKRA